MLGFGVLLEIFYEGCFVYLVGEVGIEGLWGCGGYGVGHFCCLGG